MLASLGIPPSETDDNAHLRKTIEKNRANLDMKALESQLKELNR